jgi:cyclopropane-fatty-acyl-phospholipid synthase
MSTRGDIAISYDVANEFFQLWLDDRMNYSCALWEDTDSLETAQLNKLKWIHDAAHVAPEKRVLDIGCGWGANLRYLAVDRGVKSLTGITLSQNQYRQVAAAGWPGVEVDLVAMSDYRPRQPFDALISIGMFEHVASRDDHAEGRHRALYEEYFRRAHEWTNPGAWFALQSVVSVNPLRNKMMLRRTIMLFEKIFPGGCVPTIENVVTAAEKHWELVELRTRREHYARTCGEWLRRLRRHESHIKERWGEQLFVDYQQYLEHCVTVFERGHASLMQASLRRVD